MYLTKITTVHRAHRIRFVNRGEFNSNGDYWVGDVMSGDRQRFEVKLTFKDYLRMAQRRYGNLQKKVEPHKDIVDVKNGIVDILV